MTVSNFKDVAAVIRYVCELPQGLVHLGSCFGSVSCYHSLIFSDSECDKLHVRLDLLAMIPPTDIHCISQLGGVGCSSHIVSPNDCSAVGYTQRSRSSCSIVPICCISMPCTNTDVLNTSATKYITYVHRACQIHTSEASRSFPVS